MDIEKCPKCGAKLTKGSYDIATKSFLSSLFLFGLSAPHYLWFKDNDKDSKKKLCLDYAESNKGAKCRACGLMLIDPPLVADRTESEFPSIAGKGV